MITQFSILTANVNTLIGLGYTRIEVWQSLDRGNIYEEITASVATAAYMDTLPAVTTFRMGGKLLKLIIDGAPEESIEFSTTLANWTATQVANRINEVVPGLATVVAVDDGQGVRLTSPTTGRLSSVEVTYSDADDLGLTVGVVYGKSARPTLVADTTIYLFNDPSGTAGARYKWRYSLDGSVPISSYSEYVLGNTQPLLNSSNLSVCSTTFIGLDGIPVQTKVVIASSQNPSNVYGLALNGRPMVIESGEDGYIQFTLIRGAKVRVGIEGTHFVRDFTVPNSATFDLLTVMAAAVDPFTIQSPPPFLIRRSV